MRDDEPRPVWMSLPIFYVSLGFFFCEPRDKRPMKLAQNRRGWRGGALLLAGGLAAVAVVFSAVGLARTPKTVLVGRARAHAWRPCARMHKHTVTMVSVRNVEHSLFLPGKSQFFIFYFMKT